MATTSVVSSGLSIDPTAIASPRLAPRVARRPNRLQGHALETLAHAVEYLVDSQMLEMEPEGWGSDAQAIHLLSQLSREVFGECATAVPLRHKISASLLRLFHQQNTSSKPYDTVR